MQTSPSASGNQARLPEIVIAGPSPRSELASLVERTFSASWTLENSGKDDILDLEGMSGKRYRLFVNALIAGLPDARYLEIGVWAGSTFCSAIYQNTLRAVAIDNWSGFGGPRETFFSNLARFRGENASIQIIETDFRQVDFAELGRFNVYFYDGPHQERDQFDGLRLALPAMDERFVLIVDDWNWAPVRAGTLGAIEQLHLAVEFSISIRTTLDGSHPSHDGFNAKTTDWHNGYFFAVLKKPAARQIGGVMENDRAARANIVISDARLHPTEDPSLASILVGVTFHYMPERVVYLLDVVRALADFPVRRLDVVVLTNTDDPIERGSISRLLGPGLCEGKRIEVLSCPGLAHPHDLAWKHKELISERVFPDNSPYTHFVYLEDDIRFGYANFCYFTAYRSKLAVAGVIPSFVRVEFNLADGKLYATDYLVPFHPGSGPSVIVDNYRFCDVDFPYCGLFVLDRESTKEYVASASFGRDSSASVSDWGVRERAAMGLCREHPRPGFRSRHVVPVDLNTGTVPSVCWVTHLTGNYANEPTEPYGKIPINELTSVENVNE